MVKRSDIKILIVEDEVIVAMDIQSVLEGIGYNVVDIATHDKEVFKSIEHYSPHIILMDINLGKGSKNGIEIASEVKKRYSIPFIFLTAFIDDKTISKAVRTDPVGYLTKPFKRDELKSTITLAIYKINHLKTEVKNSFIDIGHNYFYDENSLNLYFKNKEVVLSQKEKQLFNILFKQRGRVVPFDTIEHAIWKEDSISDSTLRTLVYRLRGKLEYKIIETITQQGCRLIKVE